MKFKIGISCSLVLFAITCHSNDNTDPSGHTHFPNFMICFGKIAKLYWRPKRVGKRCILDWCVKTNRCNPQYILLLCLRISEIRLLISKPQSVKACYYSCCYVIVTDNDTDNDTDNRKYIGFRVIPILLILAAIFGGSRQV